MDRVPVKSSNIRSVGYDPKRKVLEIEFKDSGVYDYADVSKRTHTNLVNAASKGKYHHKWIRDNYSYKKA